MNKYNNIANLLTRQLTGDLTPDELAMIKTWADESPQNKALVDRLNDLETLAYDLKTIHPENWNKTDLEIRKKVNAQVASLLIVDQDPMKAPDTHQTVMHRIHFLKTAWVKYAAAIIILFSIGAYLWKTQQKEKPLIKQSKPVPVTNDIPPGSNKALLTLADGSVIVLDSAANGQLAVQQGSTVTKRDGQLVYNFEATRHPGAAQPNPGSLPTYVSYNTMTTPRGGQYQLTLSDGTKVWLNAASSITYPTAFINNTREVTITGEAYFEVKKNPAKPFVVKTPKEDITVLGTSFNVNAYEDEPAVKISLLEGSVKVRDTNIKPGQAYQDGKVIPTDVNRDVAWKNGVFIFNGSDLRSVMRQLSRWYNIEVKYEGKGSDEKLIGKLSRNLPLSEVLEVLKAFRIKTRLEGKTLIVE